MRERSGRSLRASRRGILDAIRGIVLAVALLIGVILVGIFFLLDFALVAPIIIVLIGAVVLVLGLGHAAVEVIGGIIAVLGVADLFVVSAGNSLTLSVFPWPNGPAAALLHVALLVHTGVP